LEIAVNDKKEGGEQRLSYASDNRTAALSGAENNSSVNRWKRAAAGNGWALPRSQWSPNQAR